MFALCYGIGFSLLITRLIKAIGPESTRWMIFNLLPFAIAVADYTENICILCMLKVYPKSVPELGAMAGVATLSKQLLTFVTLIVVLSGTAALIVRKFKER